MGGEFTYPKIVSQNGFEPWPPGSRGPFFWANSAGGYGLLFVGLGGLKGSNQRTHAVDGCEIHFAPPKRPWSDDSPVNTGKQWLPMVSKWGRISSIKRRCPFWISLDRHGWVPLV